MRGTTRESGLKSEDLREVCTDASGKIDRLIYLSSAKRRPAGGSVSPVTERRAQTMMVGSSLRDCKSDCKSTKKRASAKSQSTWPAVLDRHGARKARRPDAAMRARLTLGGRRRRGDRTPRWPEKAKTKEAGPICSAAACRARRRWARSRAACRAQATTGAAARTHDDSDHNETDDDAAQATCAW